MKTKNLHLVHELKEELPEVCTEHWCIEDTEVYFLSKLYNSALDSTSPWPLMEDTAAKERHLYLHSDNPALGSNGPKFKARYREEENNLKLGPLHLSLP